MPPITNDKIANAIASYTCITKVASQSIDTEVFKYEDPDDAIGLAPILLTGTGVINCDEVEIIPSP